MQTPEKQYYLSKLLGYVWLIVIQKFKHISKTIFYSSFVTYVVHLYIINNYYYYIPCGHSHYYYVSDYTKMV